MKKTYVLAVMAMMCLFGMGKTAVAQDPEALVVNVPFDFVAAARSMPAGTYRVSRIALDAHSGLKISGQENSAFVLPIALDDASGEQSDSLNFERVGNKYILTKVETPDHAYTITVPRPMTTLVQVKDRTDAVSPGTK
jgi:hypothetical protein